MKRNELEYIETAVQDIFEISTEKRWIDSLDQERIKVKSEEALRVIRLELAKTKALKKKGKKK